MRNKTRFKKGNIPWNKGRKETRPEVLEKLSKSLLGRIVWNKGTKGISKANSGSFKKGEHPSRATEFKKGENLGESHPQWKGGRHKLKTGYVMIKAYGHPKAYRNEVYEHIIVAEKKLGRYLKENERVHHINGIKDDNREENIVVCQSHKEHMSIYHKLKTWSKKYKECRRCKTIQIKHAGLGLCKNCYKYCIYHKINV